MSGTEAPPGATLVNGEAGTTVSVHDRGLHYGDGLFETITCNAGRPRWLDRHLQRLARGAQCLGLQVPPAALLASEMAVLAAGHERCILKLILTRGVGSRRGYRPSGDEQPTRVLGRYPWPVPVPGDFLVDLSPVPLGANALLAGLKHLNRLEQVLAQQRAAAAGVHESLMCDAAGSVIAGSMSNLFVLQADELLTPQIRDCGVAGVMRSLVIEVAPTLGLRVREVRLEPRFLLAVPALFLTNVRMGLQPVHCYLGRRLEPDPRVQRLQELIDATVQ